MYLADTNILLRFLLRNDPAYPYHPPSRQNPEDPPRTVLLVAQSLYDVEWPE
jgi:hypothetical protein